MKETTMQAQPYLFFDGRCDEAIEFYRGAVGAEVEMMLRFKDAPPPHQCQPGTENKVMHANLRVGESTVLVSDGHCEGKMNFQGFGISLTVATEAEADRMFANLSAGGEVRMPLDKTFFSARFGMCVDHFGVLWMVYMAK
jgi:PhnB protein